MTSSESEGLAQKSRKRARKSNSGEDGAAGGKKTRGRPRVDTQDSTAAERRRTQIRLAQRAYRQRKETTIVSLQRQSTQLHSIIEQMDKTFHQLAESTQKSGLLQLNHNLAQEFKLARETFSTLTKAASEAQSLVDEDGEQSAEGNVPQKPSEREPEPELHHVGWGYSTVSQLPSKDISMTDSYASHLSTTGDPMVPSITSRYQFNFGEQFDHTHGVLHLVSDPLPPRTSSQQELPFGLVPLQDQLQTPYETPNPYVYTNNMQNPSATPSSTGLLMPSPPVSNLSVKTLAAAKTYSFDESTLGRRIARATAEFAFQALTKFNYPPSVINRTFKLNFPYYNHEQLRERFRLVLSKNMYEDLDWLESPFGHLGGAGSHYPRRDAAGNIIPKKSSQTSIWIGPRQKKTSGPEHPEDGTVEYMHGVDLSGYEGEWFDPYDVQGYLEERYACKMDPASSFAECLVEIEGEGQASLYPDAQRQPLENGLSKHSTLGPHTSYDDSLSSNGPGDFTKLVDHDISFDQTLGLDLAPGFDYGFAGSIGFGTELGLGVMNENTGGLQVVRQRKRRAWLDVPRLVHEIVRAAVCLGRTPGYRRADIDRAVQQALIEDS